MKNILLIALFTLFASTAYAAKNGNGTTGNPTTGGPTPTPEVNTPNGDPLCVVRPQTKTIIQWYPRATAPADRWRVVQNVERDTTLSIEKFDSEDPIRRFILQYNSDFAAFAVRGINWPTKYWESRNLFMGRVTINFVDSCGKNNRQHFRIVNRVRSGYVAKIAARVVVNGTLVNRKVTSSLTECRRVNRDYMNAAGIVPAAGQPHPSQCIVYHVRG